VGLAEAHAVGAVVTLDRPHDLVDPPHSPRSIVSAWAHLARRSPLSRRFLTIVTCMGLPIATRNRTLTSGIALVDRGANKNLYC
jgi:hypothetical protein